MNRQIRAVSLLAGLMFLALMVNLTGSAMFRQASLNNDPHNVRVRDAEFSQNRGNILVGSRPIAIKHITTNWGHALSQSTLNRPMETFPKDH